MAKLSCVQLSQCLSRWSCCWLSLRFCWQENERHFFPNFGNWCYNWNWFRQNWSDRLGDGVLLEWEKKVKKSERCDFVVFEDLSDMHVRVVYIFIFWLSVIFLEVAIFFNPETWAVLLLLLALFLIFLKILKSILVLVLLLFLLLIRFLTWKFKELDSFFKLKCVYKNVWKNLGFFKNKIKFQGSV